MWYTEHNADKLLIPNTSIAKRILPAVMRWAGFSIYQIHMHAVDPLVIIHTDAREYYL